MAKGVILIGVGRNLNRAVRTCYSFGVYDIYCLNCPGQVKGNLFSARGARLHRIESLAGFDRESILALEVIKSLPVLAAINSHSIEYLAVGGETTTLRRRDFPRMARIPTGDNLCLTTEAALAIGLYHLEVLAHD